MSLQISYERLRKTLPSPLETSISAFLAESADFAKLHRLIDAYEVGLKLLAAASVQRFYSLGLEKEFPDVDVTIRETISRASAGHWVKYLRISSQHVRSKPISAIATEFWKPELEVVCSRLGDLRNTFRGHGATLSDSKAAPVVADHLSYLEELVNHYQLWSEFSLRWTQGPTVSQGLPYKLEDRPAPDWHPESPRERPTLNHVLLYHEASKEYVDLYPLIVFETSGKNPGRILFVNSWEKRKCEFLDYATGEHIYLESPHEVIGALEQAFPRSPGEADKAQPNYFTDLAESVTVNFVGRERELEYLRKFGAGGGLKRVLIVLGSPGIGKTSLLAQFGKKEASLRHFIREGDAGTAEPTVLFENLGVQLASTYKLEWKRPPTLAIPAYRAEFDRLLKEAAQKANSPIVVQIDGLDEGERTSVSRKPGKGGDSIIKCLPDPALAPANVQWILSARPEVLAGPDFAAKFQTDKAEHLTLHGLRADEIRALLFLVCRWQEIIVAGDKVNFILERSEGSPLYLRLLLEDLALGRISLSRLDKIPVGVQAYFSRIFEVIQKQAEATRGPNARELVRSKVELLNQMVQKGDISSKRYEELCKHVADEQKQTARLDALELLAIFVVATEPFLFSDAAQVLDKTEAESEAFRVIRTVLTEVREDQFSLFHGAFREFVLSRRPDLCESIRASLLAWCLRFREHKRPYAIRNVVMHLFARMLVEPNQDTASSLEAVLTDLTYVSLKIQVASAADLLHEYQLALENWKCQETLIAHTPPGEPIYQECQAPTVAASRLRDEREVLGAFRKVRDAKNWGASMGFVYVPGDGAHLAPDETAPSRWFESNLTLSPRNQEIAAAKSASAATESSPLDRIRQFAAFVQTWLPSTSDGNVDVVALAYNQAASGLVAERAAPLVEKRQSQWIKRRVRPEIPEVFPLVIQSFAGIGEVAITLDFHHVIVGLIGSREIPSKLKFFDAVTGRLEKELSADANPEVRLPDNMLVSGNGEVIVFGGSVWSTKKETIQSTVMPPTRAAAISGDGTLLVTASSETALKVWGAADGLLCRTIECDDHEVHSLSLSEHGLLLAVGCHDHRMQIYEVGTGECLLTFMTAHHVVSVALTPSGKFVAFGCRDRVARVLYLPERTLVREFRHDDEVWAVAISQDGRFLVSIDWKRTMRVWDVPNGSLLRTIILHAPVTNLVLSPDAALAFGGGRLWDIKRGNAPRKLRESEDPAVAVAFWGSQLVALGTQKAEVEIWSWNSNGVGFSCLGRYPLELPNPETQTTPAAVAIGQRELGTFLIALSDGSVWEWDSAGQKARNCIDTNEIVQLKETEMRNVQRRVDQVKLKGVDPEICELLEQGQPQRRDYKVDSASFSANGEILATAVFGEAVRIWDTRTGKCVASFPVHVKERISQGEILGLKLLQAGSTVIFVTSDGELRRWDYKSGHCESTGYNASVDFGQTIATSARRSLAIRHTSQPKNRLELWGIEPLRLIRTYPSPADYVSHMSITPDERAFICAARNHEHFPFIAVLDFSTGEVLATYPTKTDIVSLSEIAQDGQFACGTADGDLHILQLIGLSNVT